MGRLFDAAASITGIRQKVNYEAQAAIEFEALADPDEKGDYNLPVELDENSVNGSYQVNPMPLIEQLLTDIHKGIPIAAISARFHNSIASMVTKVCSTIRNDFGINDVVLSGGVWQNMTLLRRTHDRLGADNFKVHIHHQVPTNDGGLSLGQAAVAINRLTK
jgi:hydrogenase maturation protein HypF